MKMRLYYLAFLLFILPAISLSFAWDSGGLYAQPDREGLDYALFFPVNEYEREDLPELKSSISDARDIAFHLKNRFGFQTAIYPDATSDEIQDILYAYKKKYAEGTFPKEGQLFIFFSGHGIPDYFLPTDANPLEPARKGINYDSWRSELDDFDCKHILVAVDACYSATFDPTYPSKSFEGFARPGGELTEVERILANHSKHKSRVFFTSDASENKTPGVSNFAKQLKEGLAEMHDEKGFFNTSQLFADYIKTTSPAPSAGEFEGDEASSNFLFFHDTVRMNPITQRLPSEGEAWQAALEQDICSGYRSYLEMFPSGNFVFEAKKKLEPCDLMDARYDAWEVAKNQNTCESYEAFMTDHPRTELAKEAKRMWKSIDCTPKAEPGKLTYFVAGSYKMGDEVTKPEYEAHVVHDAKVITFYLSATELTNKEYVIFLNDRKNKIQGNATWYKLEGQYTGIERAGARFVVKEGMEDYPVNNVTWYGAIAYCNWLSEKEKLTPVYKASDTKVVADWSANGYRLPTEAEWEYAARSGGDKEEWSGTSSRSLLPEFANIRGSDDGFSKLAPISSLQANKKGLADMSGNIAEWCWDWKNNDYYKSAPVNHPKGPSSGRQRVIRGGSWNHAIDYCKTTTRWGLSPGSTMPNIGFRLARNWSRNTYGRPTLNGDRRANGGN